MAYKNKADQAAAAKRHYEKNKEMMKARAIAHRRQHQEKINILIADIKSAGCTDCKKIYPPYVMDFDHISDDKEHNVSKMVSDGFSWENIKREIDKCEVVCANCHRERTHRRGVEKLGISLGS